MFILGYAGYSLTLRNQNILINRTCREATIKIKGMEYLEELLEKNLIDLIKTMEYNAKMNIKFYRISSDIAPHCSNPHLLKESDLNDYTKLVYNLDKYKDYFKKIGIIAKTNSIRLTFHPGIFDVLNSPDSRIVLRTFRDLYFHTKILELMELDLNSVIILHGGGVYGDKPKAMQRWMLNFDKLPLNIKQRVVLENDESSFSIDNILEMSKTKTFQVPVVFDIFHYFCYNLYIIKKETSEIQKEMKEILPLVKLTWGDRQMKMHISEQLENVVIGAHSDYVETIPKQVIDFMKYLESKGEDLYLMIECKMKDIGLFHLRDKYPKLCL